jgi:hypothetical protein
MDLRPKPIALLPQDREIMEITGLNEEQYRSFVLECYRQGKLKPGEPTNFLVIPFLIQLAIGVALTYLSTLLAPKPEQPEEPKAQKNKGGQNYVSGQRSAPTSGFDTVQNVVELGSVVPLIYANRRQVNGRWYGGVRANTNLLWSQLYSVGGGQLLRAVFSVGEGTVPEPAVNQYAIGNNLIRNFDLQDNNTSRISLYYVDGSETSNRINSGDHIAGRLPGADLGNAENDGAADVFQVRTANGWAPDFSYVSTPSNQTSFGLGPFIGNNMPYRKSPQIKPRENYDTGAGNVNNLQAIVDRRKDDWRYYGRAGVVGGDGSLVNFAVGDRFTYRIFSNSDYRGKFTTQRGSKEVENDTKDVASAVASRQNGYDDAIQIGERYLAGTCTVVCIDRSDEAFNSETNNTPVRGGNDIYATFEVVRAGSVHRYSEALLNPGLGEDNQPARAPAINGTNKTHLMRVSEGFISVERETQYIELGLRSTVNMNLSNICAFANVDRSYDDIDEENKEENSYYTNPTYTSPETRYSFFRVSYRVAGAGNFTDIPCLFAVRSLSSNSVYNYLRLEFPTAATYEIQFLPISGFEARNYSQQINVLDYKSANRETFTGGGVTVRYSGVSALARTTDNFAVPILRNEADITPKDDGDYHGDAFARMAESFIFNEITSSATGPEHDIVYVNTQTENGVAPNYSNLAMIGMNIRSSTEITALQQFSVYCNQGIGSTNKFPEVLYDLMTNTRYGAGNILNAEQIDRDSFDAAADFCEGRRYFFDGIIDDKINIRSWGAQVARNYLLDLVIRNGKFALQPVCDFDNPVTVTGLFTAGNIIEDTFEMSYADEQNRIPPRVSVRWREEKANTENGLFPVVRQLTVREASTPEDAPLESVDLSEYCTSEEQAIDVAKYICRTRRLITHSVKFSTTPTQAALDIGAIFKLGMETVTYEQPQNGAISDQGVVTAWPPLSDGTYDVLLWDGTGTNIQEVSMVVSSGTTTYRNAVFCLRNAVSNTQTYKTQSLSYNEDGNIEVEATIYPTNAAGVSLIVDGWDTAANWDIEGQLY